MKYVLTILSLLLFGTIGAPRAAEWQPQSFVDAKIVLHTGWPWTAPHRGQYGQTWTDDYKIRLYYAGWAEGSYPRVEMVLYRVGPLLHWRYVPKLNKKALYEWHHLKKNGVAEITEVPCEVHKCITFKTESFPCLAFTRVTGVIGKRVEGDADTDVVTGYYCKHSSQSITPREIDDFLQSIVVRK